MSTKISDLAEKLGLDAKALREKISELGFEVGPRARTIDPEVAELVYEELKTDQKGDDIVEIYDEIIAEEREREIVKSQRKKMAGRNEKKKKYKKNRAHQTSGGPVQIADSISVKEFSEKSGVSAAKVIGELMKNGILANINQALDFETAQIIGEELGIAIEKIRTVGTTEDLISGDLDNLTKEDDADLLEERPAVVCVMGHVDHGKTKLLDSIRNADVVSGESGGITQHIAAYQVEKKGKLITFLDTPGHEAFTAMRARGAKVTDIAILVVAADEGIKPQTIEALNHAKEAGVPIIVAANKMDKPEANLEKLKGELTEHGLQPEDWGGSTVVVPVSALKGEGISELLEMVILTAEMEELKANPDREAVGTIVEAHLDKSLGPVATVLINTGTLMVTNNFIVGNTYGRVKLMKDHHGKTLRAAGPSRPVFVAGFNETPKSGDILHVVKNEKIAREKAAEIKLHLAEQEAKMSGANKMFSQIKNEKILKIILKADVKGTLEAIKQSLAKIEDKEVAVKVIHSGVGSITESDVMMAMAGGALVVGFHVDFSSHNVKKIAENSDVKVNKYTVIYDMLEDVKVLLSGLIEPEIVENILGRMEIKQIFLRKKKELIVGGRITSGKVINKGKVKIVRGSDEDGDDIIVGKGQIMSLRKVDDVVKELKEGNECGIRYVGDMDVQEKDTFLVYEEQELRRTIQ
jgi:translation initiation factor IF-2